MKMQQKDSSTVAIKYLHTLFTFLVFIVMSQSEHKTIKLDTFHLMWI